MSKPIPKRPYLLRAMYEWIVDNGMTPHILVDARSEQVSVPRQYVQDGNIVLNISPTAANGLMIRNEEVTFSARFGGKAFSIWLPMWSIMAIYTRESQEWVSFPADEYDSETSDVDKVDEAVSNVGLTPVERGASDENDDDDEPPPSKPTKRPALRVVK